VEVVKRSCAGSPETSWPPASSRSSMLLLPAGYGARPRPVLDSAAAAHGQGEWKGWR
jgi:hypothetical protein